mmetsp:Transcript_27084/g.85148  ORF Transcript_27084/g.85148 Transcript_27084/m.85148 type:complete len:269 (+) Transcript_27084:133-939(+)|eukprot:CAMPEP_0118851248 /NCGR_PEP_ID=MMETSP1163-20130328/754_1 /TAXON_ID=124430 /ORGANISM="Phaeomonas parva, Strain CCMP2877" /LENGTH=268 /DNA_ID=CAMNT_0006783553 /DNA_START=152 /DNA_END=958 /DNA_ORIENTATION=+
MHPQMLLTHTHTHRRVVLLGDGDFVPGFHLRQPQVENAVLQRRDGARGVHGARQADAAAHPAARRVGLRTLAEVVRSSALRHLLGDSRGVVLLGLGDVGVVLREFLPLGGISVGVVVGGLCRGSRHRLFGLRLRGGRSGRLSCALRGGARGDGQDLAVEVDLDVLAAEAGDVGVDEDLIVALAHVELNVGDAQLLGDDRGGGGVKEGVVEEEGQGVAGAPGAAGGAARGALEVEGEGAEREHDAVALGVVAASIALGNRAAAGLHVPS